MWSKVYALFLFHGSETSVKRYTEIMAEIFNRSTACFVLHCMKGIRPKAQLLCHQVELCMCILEAEAISVSRKCCGILIKLKPLVTKGSRSIAMQGRHTKSNCGCCLVVASWLISTDVLATPLADLQLSITKLQLLRVKWGGGGGKGSCR